MKLSIVILLLFVFLASCSEQETQGILDASTYHTYKPLSSGLQFDSLKKGRVAFLGGSITYNPGWRDSVSNYFQHRFPDTEFEFINAGIPSMGSTPGAFRLARDVLSQGKIDLIFVEAAVNDATNGRTGDEQIKAMEGIIRHLKASNPSIDIVLMYFVDPDKIKDYNEGRTPEVIQNHSSVASFYSLPEINLAKEVRDRIEAGEFTWEDDFVNLHPSPFGQGIYARSMITFLHNSFSNPVRVEPENNALPPKINSGCYDNGILVDASKSDAIGWRRSNLWIPEDEVGTRENYTNVPMLIGDDSMDTLKFSYSGTAVGIAVAAGPDAGVILYSIDESPFSEIDTKTKWSNSLHLPWYYTLAHDQPDTVHTIRIAVKENSGVCRIRYFFVNQPAGR